MLSSITATAGAENSRLTGKWIMQSSSMQFPDSCKSMTFQFLADGTYIGDDGSMVLTMKYEMAEVGNGLVLTFSPPFRITGTQTAKGYRHNSYDNILFENHLYGSRKTKRPCGCILVQLHSRRTRSCGNRIESHIGQKRTVKRSVGKDVKMSATYNATGAVNTNKPNDCTPLTLRIKHIYSELPICRVSPTVVFTGKGV